MSVNIHLVARRISDDSVVFEATASKHESARLWKLFDVDTTVYPDSTGSVFRDMPGHVAAEFIGAKNPSHTDTPLLFALLLVLNRATEPLNVSIIWS
jgi:hypothetical protein